MLYLLPPQNDIFRPPFSYILAPTLTLLSVGKNVDQVMEYLETCFPTPGDEEECAFWTSLAYTLWKYGLLPDWVRDKTIDVIKNSNDIELFLSAHDQQERILRLKELETILLSENPKPTKIKKCFVNRTEFAKGDVIALPIDSQFVYFHVVVVIRISEKISELSRDEVYVKIFDILSQHLLTIKQLEDIPYKQLTADEDIKIQNDDCKKPLPYRGLSDDEIEETKYIRSIYCFSAREKKSIESRMIKVGYLPSNTVKCRSVYADYQYANLDSTLRHLFGLGRESTDKIKEIKDVLLEETRFLKECGYDQIVERDDFWNYTLSYLSLEYGYAIEFEIDIREKEVLVLITELDSKNLPGGYYMNEGKTVRTHIEHYLKNKNINPEMVREIFELHKDNKGDMSHKMILLIKAYCILVKENLADIGK